MLAGFYLTMIPFRRILTRPAGQQGEMPFLDHLEELRWHVIRAFIAVVVLALVAFFNKDILISTILLGPTHLDFVTYRAMCRLSEVVNAEGLCVEKINFIIQSRKLASQFMTHLTVSIVGGVVIAFPYIFWEVWRFIGPGLSDFERKNVKGAVAAVSFMFFTGILFGYFVLAPLSINFLAGYQLDPSIENQFDLQSYMSTLLLMVMSCGIVFQLPVVVYALARTGILTPALMRLYRKHAIVIIMFLSAIITPSPDIFTQLIVAVPLLMLYEMSIYIAGRAVKSRLEAANLQQKAD